MTTDRAGGGASGGSADNGIADNGGTTGSGGAAAVGGSGTENTGGDGPNPIGGTGAVLSPGCNGTGQAQQLLSQYVVDEAHVARRTFYSWTTAAQIDELRLDPTLLTRSANSSGELGRATDFIQTLAARDEVSAILAGPSFANKRFGWSNAWATALGWEGEDYGDQLLEIVLKDEAWIGRLTTSSGEWSFFDVNGAPVDLATVKASPARVAAFYFASDTPSVSCPRIGTVSGSAPYREYVICNEGMIAEWSASTPAILQHLTTAISSIEAFRNALSEPGCVIANEDIECFMTRAIDDWRARPKDLEGTFDASLAFPNALYMPNPTNMNLLLARLKARLFTPSPLRRTY